MEKKRLLATTDVARPSSANHLPLPDEGLARQLKPRQLVMMSLGCAIGTGLFVGSGKGIAAAGPAILVAYIVASFLVVLIMRMLGEMAAADPQSGSISVFAEKALGKSIGAWMGWLWWAQMAISVAAEATASATILHALWPQTSQWVLALIFLIVLTGVNLLGASNFGEAEFWFALLKVAAIVVFLAIGVAILLGLIPGAASPGFANLFSPHGGFMPNGFAGVAAGLLIVLFSFGGMEIVTIAAAETKDPARNVGKAIRTVLWRIILFYVGSVTIMVSVLPWDNEDLAKSPFVAVLTFAGLPGMDVVMSFVIVIALLSGLNANLYGASRLIFSLAERRRAPRALSRLSRHKVPQLAVLASSAFGFAAVILNYIWPETLLGFLLNAVGSATVAIWAAIIVSQIVLRKRADRLGTPLPLRMWAFPYLSYVAMSILAVVVMISCFNEGARNQMIATAIASVGIILACRVAIRRTDGEPMAETRISESSH